MPNGQLAEALGEPSADQLGGLIEGQGEVVALVGLGGRREDRLGQPVRFAEAAGSATPQTEPRDGTAPTPNRSDTRGPRTPRG